MTSNLQKKNNSSNSKFLISHYRSQRKWHDISKVLKEKICQTRILYPVKIPFRNEEETNTFSYERKLREFVTRRPSLKERRRATVFLCASKQIWDDKIYNTIYTCSKKLNNLDVNITTCIRFVHLIHHWWKG